MATDPIIDISIDEFDTGFSTNLGATLRELAHLSPSLDAPYVTVYLDWRPDGERPATRTARTLYDHEIAKLVDRYGSDAKARRSIIADDQKIRTFLVEDLDPAVHGVVVIACDDLDVFETIVLALPIETRISVGPTPELLPLTRVVEDYPRYAVLLADQHHAMILVINRASRLHRVHIEGDEAPKKHQQGGWSQRRFQARYEERVAHFARAVAEETRRALDEEGIEMLVVAGGEVMTSALNHAFHQTVKERIIGALPMDIRASEHEVIEATMTVVAEAERTKEQNALSALFDAIGSGDRGVSGPAKTLDALQSGTVMKLVMSSDFHSRGWADYGLNVYGVGEIPEEHPVGGKISDVHAVDLEEEMVRLTVVTGAEGEIIHRDFADPLNAIGGVGAILRY